VNAKGRLSWQSWFPKEMRLDVEGCTGQTRLGVAFAHHSERGYMLAASVQGYCAHLRKLATGRGGETAVVSATAQRGRLAMAQAEHVELKNAIARRDLVPALEIEREWSGLLRTVRAGLLAVPSRCAHRLLGQTAHDVSEIDREVRVVLTEVGTMLACASTNAGYSVSLEIEIDKYPTAAHSVAKMSVAEPHSR
jgi:phage terminase Nu1 subunit (DNA packaging protein)